MRRTGSRSKSLIAISNIAGTIDEAHNYKTATVAATVASLVSPSTFAKLPGNYCRVHLASDKS